LGLSGGDMPNVLYFRAPFVYVGDDPHGLNDSILTLMFIVMYKLLSAKVLISVVYLIMWMAT
jgi:hypothetical protein